MSHPWHHAESSVRKFGGKPEDYIAIHSWFDESKSQMAFFTHRALRHHAMGIFEAEKIFGVVLVNSDGKSVPVRFIGEQHVKEDCGGLIPSVKDWLGNLPTARWMSVGRIRDGHDDVTDLSLETWREEVAAGRTILGHAEWMDRARAINDNAAHAEKEEIHAG